MQTSGYEGSQSGADGVDGNLVAQVADAILVLLVEVEAGDRGRLGPSGKAHYPGPGSC